MIYTSMDTKKKNKAANQCFVTYIKLSVHLRQYIRSRYGKSVVILPLYSPLYGCLEQYLVNNACLHPITDRSCSQYAFTCPSDTVLPDGRDFFKPQQDEKDEYVALLMPEYIYRFCGKIPVSPFWQLSRPGTVEFNRLVKAEFWRECIRFIDECFTSARMQGTKMTRKAAISDFMTAYDIPMSYYENIIRYDQRIRKEIIEDVDKRRAWMERLNDTVMTYT